jgi:hypothetical protein
MVHATLGIPAPPREGRGGRRWLAGGVGTGRRRKGGRDQACGAGGSTRRPELISGGHRDAAIAELRVRRVFRFVWSRHEGAGRAAFACGLRRDRPAAQGGSRSSCGAGGSMRRPELIRGDHRDAAIAELRVRPVFRFVWSRHEGAGRAAFACGGRRDRLAARGRDQAAAPADRRDARSSSAAIIAVLQSLNFGSGRSSGSHSGSFGCTALRLVCLGRSGSFGCRALRLVCLGRSGSFGCTALRWSDLVTRVRLVARPSGWSALVARVRGCRALRWPALVARVHLVAGHSDGLAWSLGFV